MAEAWSGGVPPDEREGSAQPRGRGYASAVVAALSHRLLASGLRFCSLDTDLANAATNAIYRRPG